VAGRLRGACGSFSPVTLGHLQMLRQAQARLESAGYVVCGGWLSPASDTEASKMALRHGGPELSSAFRLHLAALATQSDPFISVTSWEASHSGRAPDYVEVLSMLQRVLLTALPEQTRNRFVHVFLVCGSDERKHFTGMLTSQCQGLIIVPQRHSDDCILEKPHGLVYLAEAPPGRLYSVTTAKLRTALRNGDGAYVEEAMPAEAARAVLEPTERERSSFAGDLQRLGASPAASFPWPAAKFAKRLLRASEGRLLAVLVASGTMSPVHRGHVQMLHQAKDRLEHAGYTVVGAWLSPTNDLRAFREAKSSGSPELRSAFRQRVAELSVCDDDFVSVGSWEAGVETVTPREVAEKLRSRLKLRFQHSLEGMELVAFYVCGSDYAKRMSLAKGFQGPPHLGIVIVPREGEDEVFMEMPHQLVFQTDALKGDAAALSSTRLREAIKAGDSLKAAKYMALAAARFTLAPTAAERLEFQSDFEQLGIAAPEASELAQMQETLKTTLKAWVGPSGTIGAEDLGRLLRLLDPSWTSQELNALLEQAATASDGRVVSDDFIDWIFSSQLQAAAA